MPRKEARTLKHGYPVTPYELGEQLIDDEGDSMAQNDHDALRVYPVGVGREGRSHPASLTDVKSVLDGIYSVLRKTHLGHETNLWGKEVDAEE